MRPKRPSRSFHPLIVVYLTSLLTMPVELSKCIFNEVQPNVVPSVSVQYDIPAKSSTSKQRSKRDVEDLYQPIRINIEFHDLDDELTGPQQENLKSVVKETVEKVSRIFKVVPVKERLLLGRSFHEACKNKLVSGINSGKCYTMKSTYKGEYCLDWFKIPDDHLEGFYLYNSTNPDPVKEVFASGAGLPNIDYILYVRALTSQTCIKKGLSIIAYAGYCQLDQMDRPVAGYINFCPLFIRDHTYNREKASLTALHELFHALGFASDLFPKYKDCQPSGTSLSCTTRHSPVREVFGVSRLVSPRVVNLTSEHFNCRSHPTENEFGPILQKENDKVDSHWDSAFMYGSLMTANIGLPHLTFLDPITLATFEDTGWYKVNYDYADNFVWGKDGGCQFGLAEGCQKANSSYFCRGSSQGCHFLHYDKGVCETDLYLHECRVFKAKPGDSCTELNNSPPAEEIKYTGEAYGKNSRCFVSNLTMTEKLSPVIDIVPGGRCYNTVCNDTNLFVQLNEGIFHICPWGKTIEIPGYTGVVQCPEQNVLCHDAKVTVTPTSEPIPEVTQKNPSAKVDTMGDVCIDLQYDRATYGFVRLDLRLFQRCNLDVILKITRVNRHRLENYYILEGYDNSAVFRFNLLPAKYSNQGPPSKEAITLLKIAVNTGNFTFIIPPSGPKYTATHMIVKDLSRKEAKQPQPKYVIATAAVGSVVVIIIAIVVLVRCLRNSSANHIPYSNNSRNLRRRGRRSRHLPSRSQLTSMESRLEISESGSQSAGSQSIQRDASFRLYQHHSRQDSQSSTFHCPPSAQAYSDGVDSIEGSTQSDLYHYNHNDYSQVDRSNAQGHINKAFQPTESPLGTCSATHDMDMCNITYPSMVQPSLAENSNEKGGDMQQSNTDTRLD